MLRKVKAPTPKKVAKTILENWVWTKWAIIFFFTSYYYLSIDLL